LLLLLSHYASILLDFTILCLDLLRKLEDIPNPENYYHAMKGIGVVTCMLVQSVESMAFAYFYLWSLLVNLASFLRLNAAPTDKSISKPPDGNTILAIVGGWLFEAIHTYQVSIDQSIKLLISRARACTRILQPT
jgi:hypothetical protein